MENVLVNGFDNESSASGESETLVTKIAGSWDGYIIFMPANVVLLQIVN